MNIDLNAFPELQKDSKESNEPQIEIVSIRCLRPMIVKITGEVSGIEYIFNGGGSVVGVDSRDVDGIMRRNRTIKNCCGSISSNTYFEIV